MTPTEFAAWTGGITGGLMGLVRAIAFLMEKLGIRPVDRRTEREEVIQRLKNDAAECEKIMDEKDRALREANNRVAYLEGILMRQGWMDDQRRGKS
jgi:hypothetical protein